MESRAPEAKVVFIKNERTAFVPEGLRQDAQSVGQFVHNGCGQMEVVFILGQGRERPVIPVKLANCYGGSQERVGGHSFQTSLFGCCQEVLQACFVVFQSEGRCKKCQTLESLDGHA